MPIRRELLQYYGRTWREVTRPRILARDGNKCKRCGAPNHAEVWRLGGGWWDRATNHWFHPEGIRPPWGAQSRFVRIVLTVAHLDHVAGHDDDDNLAALCQWCHLHHDLEQHHLTRAARKDAARPLLLTLCHEPQVLLHPGGSLVSN